LDADQSAVRSGALCDALRRREAVGLRDRAPDAANVAAACGRLVKAAIVKPLVAEASLVSRHCQCSFVVVH